MVLLVRRGERTGGTVGAGEGGRRRGGVDPVDGVGDRDDGGRRGVEVCGVPAGERGGEVGREACEELRDLGAPCVGEADGAAAAVVVGDRALDETGRILDQLLLPRDAACG